VEVTKPSTPLVYGVVFGRLGEHAGRNASERRAGLEAGYVGADLPGFQGSPPLPDATSDAMRESHRGSGAGMHTRGKRHSRWTRDFEGRSASKIGSKTNTAAVCTTRSRTVGMPDGLVLPFGLGMCTRRSACGR